MAIQYTIRNIPPEVDMVLKKRAKVTNKSFNQIVVEELSKSVLKQAKTSRFDWLVGSMSKEDGRLFDAALEDMNKIDTEFWK